MDSRRIPIESASGPFRWPPLAATVHWFIPRQMRIATEPFREGQRVVALHLALFVWGPIYAAILLALQVPYCALIMLCSAWLNLGSLLLLRVTKSPAVCGNVLAGVIWWTASAVMLFTGGLHSPILPWFACIPAVALMLSSTRAGLLWATVAGLTITGFSFASWLSFPLHNELTPFTATFLSYLGTLTLITAVFIMTWLFRNFENRARQSLQDANHILELQALTDPLTGIPNRRSFQRALESEWNRHERIGLPMSLLILDVDFFKRFNDAAGHGAGDESLCAVAQAIQTTLHRPSDLVSRFGGEEFSVILPNTGEIDAAAIAERIRLNVASLRIPHPDSPLGDYVTVSIGCGTIVPMRHETLGVFVQDVDRALYRAKAAGRNQTVSTEIVPAVTL